jgi:hypothetical protein
MRGDGLAANRDETATASKKRITTHVGAMKDLGGGVIMPKIGQGESWGYKRLWSGRCEIAFKSVLISKERDFRFYILHSHTGRGILKRGIGPYDRARTI